MRLGCVLLAVLFLLGAGCSSSSGGGSGQGSGGGGSGAGEGGTGGSGGSGGSGGAGGDGPQAAWLDRDGEVLSVPLHGSLRVVVSVDREVVGEGVVELAFEGMLPRGISVAPRDERPAGEERPRIAIARGESEASFHLFSGRDIEALERPAPLSIQGSSGAWSGVATLQVEVAAIVSSPADSGEGSLRDMLASAPLLAEEPTIRFSPTVFPEASAPHLIRLDEALVIEAGLRLVGPGITLDAEGRDRVFVISSGGEEEVVALFGLRIRGGASPAEGGCILSEMALWLDEVEVVDCEAAGAGGGLHLARPGAEALQVSGGRFEGNEAGGDGGGVYVEGLGRLEGVRFEANESEGQGGALFIQGPSVSLRSFHLIGSQFVENLSGASGGAISLADQIRLGVEGSTFLRNEARGHGGAIHARAPAELVIEESTLAENSTTWTDTGARGGGIAAEGGLKLRASTLRENLAGDVGGAIYAETQLEVLDSTLHANEGSFGGGILISAIEDALIQNCTIAQNRALSGAGIEAWDSSLGIRHVTLAKNDAYGEGTIVSGLGGGLSLGPGSLAHLEGSLIAMNVSALMGPDLHIQGGIVSRGGNLIGDVSGMHPVTGFEPSDRVGASDSSPPSVIDPMLGPLEDHGGPTETMAPLEGSPAIDGAGSGPCSVDQDQRGIDRPQGGGCDVGAVELEP